MLTPSTSHLLGFSSTPHLHPFYDFVAGRSSCAIPARTNHGFNEERWAALWARWMAATRKSNVSQPPLNLGQVGSPGCFKWVRDALCLLNDFVQKVVQDRKGDSAPSLAKVDSGRPYLPPVQVCSDSPDGFGTFFSHRSSMRTSRKPGCHISAEKVTLSLLETTFCMLPFGTYHGRGTDMWPRETARHLFNVTFEFSHQYTVSGPQSDWPMFRIGPLLGCRIPFSAQTRMYNEGVQAVEKGHTLGPLGED